MDNVKEYVAKVKFLDGVCPPKDRSMLAPRLAMLTKGTAWAQVRTLDPSLLTDSTPKNLLQALSGWEESADMKTFDLFERAVYRTLQKSDESTMSFVNRLQVAFTELGNVTIKEFQAFLLLRQSTLGTEDKKRILTMTDGKMETLAIEKALRTLSASVLNNGMDPKKKVYPTNFVEPEWSEPVENHTSLSSTFVTMEEEEIDSETVEVLVAQGDPDAIQVQAFEQDLSDMFQDAPELHNALISYQEARSKLTEKKKFRGFWPSKGKGKGFGKIFGQRKGGSKGAGKADLLARISRTNCKICGERGHWKAECPRNPDRTAKDSVNLASQIPDSERSMRHEDVSEAHVIVEEWSDGEGEVHQALTAQDVDVQAGYPSSVPFKFSQDPFMFRKNQKPVTNQFSENVSKSVQEFWQQRLIGRNGPSSSMECFVNKGPDSPCVSEKLQGFAILDTGASRSVIGSDICHSC